jgi:hypothetical protein
MKIIKNVHTNEVKKVTNERAEELVHGFTWKYVPKSEFKKQNINKKENGSVK